MKPSEIVPPPYGRIFSIYESFNTIQTSLLNDLLYTDKSVVLSAPTGSGKTVAFEMAIVRMLMESDRMPCTSNNNILPKAIYIAPIKALCNEKFENWKQRFDAVGINCAQVTGDTQVTNLMALRQAQIVICTPEKWDSITRRWHEFEKLMSSIQLFIVDEVHLLNEDIRGPTLEAIVARMKSYGVRRFIVASATIPNVEDLTSWIRNCSNRNVAQYIFNEMQRPVPLEKHVLGINTKLEGFQFDMKLNYQLADVIRKYSERKATLIFCNSRKSAEMAAFNLAKKNDIYKLNNQQKTQLNEISERLIDTKLKKLVENGIAYHHAGLQYADRQLIESSFRGGSLMILLSTSTLAMGVNLPAHLVVIKSTETYLRGNYVEYPENMILQMIGRAGRPQYDTKGIVVILTQNQKVQKYKKLMNGNVPIESNLHKNLVEHLNSEIALNSICNLETAMDWIRSTYLYIRSVKNPTHYGFQSDMSKDLVEHKLEELSFKQINSLESAGLIKSNHTNGLSVQTTPIGKLMAKHYLSFETMKKFRNLKGNENLQNIFDLIFESKELSEFTLRVNEKKILNALNKAPLRFPVKGRIKTNEQKISCVVQAILGNLEIPAPNLIQESLKMFRIGDRVAKSLLEYVRLCVVVVHEENIGSSSSSSESDNNNWYQTILNAIIAAKCFHSKLWENSEYASKQLHGIGVVYSSLLFNAGKTSLKSIAQTDARTIEQILNKAAPFGDEVLKNLLTFPEYEIQLNRLSVDFIEVYAKQVNESYVHKSGASAVIVIGDSLNNLLLFAEDFDEIFKECGYFQRKVKINNPNTVEYIYGHVVHTHLVGVDAYAMLEINAPKVVKRVKKTANKTKKQQKQITTVQQSMNDFDFLTDDDNSFNSESSNGGGHNIAHNLEIFQFTKPKLRHDDPTTVTDTVTNVTVTDEDKNKLKIATIRPLNDTSLINNTAVADSNNSTKMIRTIQSKLTHFFSQRKKPNLPAPKTSTSLDLSSNIEEGASNLVRLASNERSDTDEHSIFSDNQITELRSNSTSSSSSIKPTCIRQELPIKRKCSQNENSFEIEEQSKPKTQRIEAVKEPNPNRSAAISSASFFDDIETDVSIVEFEEIANMTTESESSAAPIETSCRSRRGGQEHTRSSSVQQSNAKENQQKQPLSTFPLYFNEFNDDIFKSKPITKNLKRPLNEIFSNQNISQLSEVHSEQKYSKLEPLNDKCATTLSSFLRIKNPTDSEIANLLKNAKKKHHHSCHLSNPIDHSMAQKCTLKPKSTKLQMNLRNNSVDRNEYEEPLNLSKYSGKIKCEKTLIETGKPKNETVDLTFNYPSDEEFSFWYTVTMNFQRLPIQAMSFENFRQVYDKVFSKETTMKKELEKYSKTKKSQEIEKVLNNTNENKSKNSAAADLNATHLTVESCHSISSESLHCLQAYVDDQRNATNNKLRRSAINAINQNIMKRVLDAKSKLSTEAENMDLEQEITNALKTIKDGSFSKYFD